MGSVKNSKKKLYSVLASLSCMNMGVSAHSNTRNDIQQSTELHTDNIDDTKKSFKVLPKIKENSNSPLEKNDNLQLRMLSPTMSNESNYSSENESTHDADENKSHGHGLLYTPTEPDVEASDSGLNLNTQAASTNPVSIEDEYTANQNQKEKWRNRLSSANAKLVDPKNTSNGKVKEIFNDFVVPGLAIAGAVGIARNTYPVMKSLFRYRYEPAIRDFKRLLEISEEPGIFHEYQCIMPNALTPDSISIQNDFIPVLNKSLQVDIIPLFKSTQILKDDASHKRSITFGPNIKTPDTFVLEKKHGKLVLEFSKNYLPNALKVYVNAAEVDIKLNDIQVQKEYSNWDVTVYQAENLTLFLEVPKDKIKKI